MSQNFRSESKLNIEINEITSVSDESSMLVTSKSKNIVKKTTRFTENISATTRQQLGTTYELNKENIVAKDSKASASNSSSNINTSSVVEQLKVYYEEFSINRTNRTIVNCPQNSMGAIKKRKNSEILGNNEEERKIVPKKRPSIRDDDAFVKSRFTVYTDKPTTTTTRHDSKESLNDNCEGKLTKKTENIGKSKLDLVAYDRYPNGNARIDGIKLRVRDEKFQSRVTPIEIPPVPLAQKKVKVLYRNRSSTNTEKPRVTQAFVSHDSEYQLPYDDCFMKYELEKEISVASFPRKYLQRNITIEQRKIIVKFLTRLNSHSNLPSFFLYQTVRLFDAVLATKDVDVKNFQLVALAAMWIALKREHIAYRIPTAEQMLSFAKDLYEGKEELLLKCEIDILQTLRFNIVFPDPFSIMCYDITKCERSQFMNSEQIHQAYFCGSYMIDVSLFDEDIMKISVVLLAATAAETALYFTMEEINDTDEPDWSTWRARHTSKSYTDQQINNVRLMLMKKLYESQKHHSDVEIVFKKYLRTRYGRISKFLGHKVKSYYIDVSSI